MLCSRPQKDLETILLAQNKRYEAALLLKGELPLTRQQAEEAATARPGTASGGAGAAAGGRGRGSGGAGVVAGHGAGRGAAGAGATATAATPRGGIRSAR